MTPTFWHGRRVLLTGHTGFKGAWASAMLAGLGAEVTAFSLTPQTDPSLWQMIEGRVAINCGFMVGHSTIRRRVMGEDWAKAADQSQIDALVVVTETHDLDIARGQRKRFAHADFETGAVSTASASARSPR